MTQTRRIQERLASIHAGRRVLIVAEVLQATSHKARAYREMGAESVFLLAGRMGSGPIPEESYALLNLPTMPFLRLIHRTQDALNDLPDSVRAAIDEWDPEGRAITVGPFYFRGDPVAGRPYFGARSTRVQALEDKARIDAMWDAAGIERAPSAVVPAQIEPLLAAHRSLDQGAGTVWAADDRDGFNGGAAGTRWVRNESLASQVFDTLSQMANNIRVMPFLDGIPCSIHGLVFGRGVAVLRPAEMVVLRTERTAEFRYLRAGTFWDPRPDDRVAMRDTARRFGEYLRTHLDYRGAFTIDGIISSDGFRPTECNPRIGAALNLMVADFPFADLADALIEGCAFDEVDPAALEAELLQTADAQRRGSMGILTHTPFQETAYRHLAWRDDAWVEVDEVDAHAKLMVGPGPSGGFINLSLDSEHILPGTSLGPRAAAFIAWADQHLGTTEGPCVPAPDLRPA